VLRNDLRRRARPVAAFALAGRGELGRPDLAHAVSGLRATVAG
jgi:hypothetical protein